MPAIADLFTPTETLLYNVLKDCKEHSAFDLLKALNDKAVTAHDLSNHIARMRKKLMDNYDIDIVHKLNGRRVEYLLVKRLYVGFGE